MAAIVAIWKRFAESVTVVAFAVMFASFVIGIASRYIFNAPISWANEVCLIAYLWVVFWSSGILVDERQHIVFDVLFNMLPPRPRRALAIIITLSIVAVFVALLPGAVDYLGFLRTRHSTTLHLPMQFVFGGFLVFNVTVIISALKRLWKLARPGWETAI